MAKKTSSAKTGKTTFTNGSKSFEEAINTGKQNFEKLFSATGNQDFAALSQQNLDAALEFSNAWANGCQEIGNNLLSLAQQNIESSLSLTKELLGCKNLQEALELQSTYAKSLIESNLTEGSKLQELSMRVANEAIEPVRERFTNTYETMLKTAAA
jgi:phasin family protein